MVGERRTTRREEGEVDQRTPRSGTAAALAAPVAAASAQVPAQQQRRRRSR